MKRLFTFIIASFSIFALQAQTTHNVSVTSNQFTPSALTIEVGDEVVWTNNGGSHNVNGTTATFPDNPESFGNSVGTGWTYSFTFNTAGEYDYQCDPHVGLGMVGTITVTEVANPPANDDVCDAEEITVDGDAVTVDNTDATQDGVAASCWDTDVTGNVWLMFEFTPSDVANGVLISTVAGTSDDSQLALWTVTGCPDGPVEMTEVACNEDISGANYMSTIAAVLEAGTYYISCGTWGEAVGSFDVQVSSILLPENNSCSGAPITDVSVGTVATATGDGTNATASGGFPVAEVWEAFTLTECADLRIDFCGSSPRQLVCISTCLMIVLLELHYLQVPLHKLVVLEAIHLLPYLSLS